MLVHLLLLKCSMFQRNIMLRSFLSTPIGCKILNGQSEALQMRIAQILTLATRFNNKS